MKFTTILAAMAASILPATAVPAGPAQPMTLRTVTMDGRTGPAFYSVVEGRYLFAAPRGAEDRQMVELSASVNR